MRILYEPEPQPSALDRLARTFRLLTNEDRLRLLCALEGPEQDVGSLAARTEMSASRVSQHLALLRAHGVVHDRRKGRHVYYRLRRPELAQWIRERASEESRRGDGGTR